MKFHKWAISWKGRTVLGIDGALYLGPLAVQLIPHRLYVDWTRRDGIVKTKSWKW
jgi:hypothetical protein